MNEYPYNQFTLKCFMRTIGVQEKFCFEKNGKLIQAKMKNILK